MRLGIEFSLELLARSAGAGAVRTSGLRHESVDDAMENDAVVKSALHKFFDARDMAGGKIRPHLDHYLSLGGIQRERVFGFCHDSLHTQHSQSQNRAGVPLSAQWWLS